MTDGDNDIVDNYEIKMKTLLDELYHSPFRNAVDREIYHTILQIKDSSLRENLLYHFNLESNLPPTFEHSKRLRAFLCSLFALESGVLEEEIIPLATTVELLHNSTLIIDDIQDHGTIRCGREALWLKVGIPSAINAGYYLGLQSLLYFQEKREHCHFFDYSAIISDLIGKLVGGQQRDLDAGNSQKTLENYYSIACGKTGALLNMACLFGSMPYFYDEEKSLLITDFTNSLSICYQILDDITDVENGAPLDSSNILYFVNQDQEKESIIKEAIISVENREIQQLFCSIDKLKNAGIIKTDKICTILEKLLKITE